MTLRREYRPQQNRIRKFCSRAGMKRMRRAGDKPIRMPRAPMRGLRCVRLGKMNAVGMSADRELGIVGDQQNQIALMGYPRQHFREPGTMGFLPRPHDHHAALWQGARGRNRIRQTLVIRQQDKRGQSASSVEPCCLSC